VVRGTYHEIAGTILRAQDGLYHEFCGTYQKPLFLHCLPIQKLKVQRYRNSCTTCCRPMRHTVEESTTVLLWTLDHNKSPSVLLWNAPLYLYPGCPVSTKLESNTSNTERATCFTLQRCRRPNTPFSPKTGANSLRARFAAKASAKRLVTQHCYVLVAIFKTFTFRAIDDERGHEEKKTRGG
jgi:hypothetical protein